MEEKLLEEIWKPVKDYEGLYEASLLGRVKSVSRSVKGRWGFTKISEKILNPIPDKDGYLIVTLCKNGKQKTKKIHRLVAEAFIPNPDNLPCINHKDENKQNNEIDNLEFCTYKYNTNYGTGIERRRKKRSKPVLQFDLNNNFIKRYESMIEAEKQLKIKHIYDCCNGKLRKAGGYIWRYENGREVA